MNIPTALAAETSLLRQNVAMSVIKASAESDQQMAKILEDSVRSAPVSGARGSLLNLLV